MPNDKIFPIGEKKSGWAKDVRTPLGLVYEGNNKHIVFYSGFKESPNWDGFNKGEKFNMTWAIGFVEPSNFYL